MEGQRTTVLVVEDDDSLREAYRDALEAYGRLRVVTFGDGLDALRYIADEIPALVVLDLALPRVTGRDLLAELRKRKATQDVPVVVVTGDESLLEGNVVDAVLITPVLMDDLLTVVLDCIHAGTDE